MKTKHPIAAGLILLFFIGILFVFITVEAKSDVEKASANKKKKVLLLQMAESLVDSLPDKAIEYAEMSRDLSTDEDTLLKAQAHFILARAYSSKRQPSEALMFGAHALEYYQKLNDKEQTAHTKLFLGNEYFKQNDYRNAILMYHRAIKNFDELKILKPEIVELYSNLGEIYTLLGEYQLAIQYHEKAIQVSAELKTSFPIAMCLNSIGEIFSKLDRPEKSEEYYLAALEEASKLKSNVISAIIYNNLSRLSIHYGKILKAIEYHKKSIDLVENEGNEKEVYLIDFYITRGDIFYYEKRYSWAENFYNLSLIISEKFHDSLNIANSLNKLAEVTIMTSEYEEAEELLRRSLQISYLIQSAENRKEAYSGLSHLYEKQGNYEKAFHYFKKFEDIKDSINSRANYHSLAELEIKYETQELEKVKEQKSQENIKLKEINKIQQLYLFLIAVLMLIILVGFYLRYRHKNKTEAVLKEKNELILKEKDDHKKALDILNAAIESTTDGIMIIDRSQNHLMYNSNFAEMLNIRAEMKGLNDCKEFFGKNQDLNEIYELIASTHKSDISHHSELTLTSGKILEYFISTFEYLNEQFGTILTLRDITIRKRSVEELNKLSKAIEHSPSEVVITNLMAKIEYVNPKFMATTGYEAADVMGKNPRILNSGKNSKELYIDMWNTILSGDEWRGELINKRKDGSLYWENVSISPIKSQDGNITHFVKVADDITEKKEVEKAVRESQERLRLLIKNSSDIIVVLDSKRRYKYISQAMKRITGYDPETLRGKEFTDIVHPEDLYYITKSFDELLNDTRREMRVEFRIITAVGEHINIEAIWNNLLDDETIGGIVVNSRDITIRKKNEMMLQDKEKRLIELNATKDKFFSIIAHDLKNPFSILQNYSLELKENYNLLDDDSRMNFINDIHDSSQSVYKLLENLLQWSRAQTGRIPFNPQEIDVYEIVFNTIYLLQNQAKSKNISIKNTIPAETEVFADYNMIMTVVRNLISNAIKFTYPNGTITVDSETADGFLTISVKDSGIGIPQEQLDKLFRIDEQFLKQGTNNETGSGLGLVLCKEFVEKNNGTINIESTAGDGTKVSFTVPLPAKNSQPQI